MKDNVVCLETYRKSKQREEIERLRKQVQDAVADLPVYPPGPYYQQSEYDYVDLNNFIFDDSYYDYPQDETEVKSYLLDSDDWEWTMVEKNENDWDVK